MSPEQAAGVAELDGRTDQYSLGCVLYEMLAGEPPWTGPTPQAVIARRMHEPPTPIRLLRAAVPAELEAALARALAREPADRFPSAAEFARVARPTRPRSTGQRAAPADCPAGRARRPALRSRRRSDSARWSRSLWAPPPCCGTGGLRSSCPRRRPPGGGAVQRARPDGLWHEGLVDVLARKFDGAGALRTVSPPVIVRRWRGGWADPASVAALGRRTGAKLAVYGSVVRSGTDSVRLTARLLDVSRERALGEHEVRGAVAQMDRLTDSLALGLLRQLGRTRPIGAVRQPGLGTRSLPALKAFLQAEQHYRRGAWDSARVYAEQAVALDSTFALAYRRLGNAIGWQTGTGDAMADAYKERAGALNHGLSPRDSLLSSLTRCSKIRIRSVRLATLPAQRGERASSRSWRRRCAGTPRTPRLGTAWARRAITWAFGWCPRRAGGRRSRLSSARLRWTRSSPRPMST